MERHPGREKYLLLGHLAWGCIHIDMSMSMCLSSQYDLEPLLQHAPCSLDPWMAATYGTLTWKPSQGTKLYCLVNRGTLVWTICPELLPPTVRQPGVEPATLWSRVWHTNHYTTEPSNSGGIGQINRMICWTSNVCCAVNESSGRRRVCRWSSACLSTGPSYVGNGVFSARCCRQHLRVVI